ncbi:MAG: hypothetical protein DMG41_08000 [Acidobacteria bacterium]|nr:MAG: hypothetical protein DMG41_08000 [Acidobacteriota bacterium]
MVRLMFMTFSGGDRSSAAEDTRISARAHPSYALTRQRGFAKMARPDKSRESRHHARAKQHDNATSSERSIKDCSAGGLAGHDSDGGDDVAVASLHRLSPEFDPSWRMVSEYAFGHYRWVLSLMFLSWEVSSWALAMAIWSQVNTNSGKVGLWFLVVAGIGEAMASFFDVTHDTGHGIAGLLGVGGFPVAALLLSASLGRTEAWSSTKKTLLWIANLSWISVVLLVATLVLMTMQLAKASGGHLPEHAPKSLPPGVLGLDGWANRLIVASYCLWVFVVAWQAIKLRRKTCNLPE